MEIFGSGLVFATHMFTPEVGSLATSQLADQALVSTIVDLSGSSSLKYSIGGLTIASTTDVSFTYPSPAQITGILKTSQVFNSVENGASTVHVVYTVADQFGRTQCSPSDVTVTLTVGTASSACFVFSSPLRPHGSCSLTVEPSTFGSSASALPVLLSLSVKSVVVQASSVGTVALAPFFVHDQPSHVGIYFQMPIYQAVPGDTFTVDMWAQTGSSSITMESWGVSLVYDFNLVSFVNVVHPLYNSAHQHRCHECAEHHGQWRFWQHHWLVLGGHPFFHCLTSSCRHYFTDNRAPYNYQRHDK